MLECDRSKSVELGSFGMVQMKSGCNEEVGVVGL